MEHKMPPGRRHGMRHRSLFSLMLVAFVVVIMLAFCGTGTVFVLSTHLYESTPNGGFAPPWAVNVSATPVAGGIVAAGPPYTGPGRTFDWRIPVSALLALGAVLVGAATVFSRRLTRPLTRLTHAARTMAEGDLNVRVRGSPVREIDDLAGAFNTMAVSLSEADRQRRQMTADVAHELRTPLAIIKGRLEGIQDGVYTATQEEVAALLNETALVERLIEDLRLLALADAGQLPLHKESIDPASMLRSVGQSFAQQAQGQGVTLSVSVLPPLPEVEADPQRISQVLGNLVANSLRHTPPGGSVTLSAWVSEQQVAGNGEVRQVLCMSVSDTGSGIAAEDLPHIFDRFYRADAARTRTSGGAGLGLAIAKRIVEAHHGTIWAESSPGLGTRVTFALPVVPRRADSAKGQYRPIPPPPGD